LTEAEREKICVWSPGRLERAGYLLLFLDICGSVPTFQFYTALVC
jgi:hypothetical protein